MFSPLVLESDSSVDTSVVSETSVVSVGSSLPDLDSVHEPVLDSDFPDFFDIFTEPMRDLTNIPETWQF
jgi:hypothetical protein